VHLPNYPNALINQIDHPKPIQSMQTVFAVNLLLAFFRQLFQSVTTLAELSAVIFAESRQGT
jgi:hypothetical protein